MREIQAIDGEEFGWRGVIITTQQRGINAAIIRISWPEANKLQADLRQLLTHAGATPRDVTDE